MQVRSMKSKLQLVNYEATRLDLEHADHVLAIAPFDILEESPNF